MLKKKYSLSFLLLTALLFTSIQLDPKQRQEHTPKLIAVIIIDQFAFHYVPKLRHNFNYGLKELFNKGFFYTNAYHAHGIPETTPGHHAISTGTLPKDHGGIANQWFDKNYKKIAYDCDNSPDAAVFKNCQETMPGKSCKKTMVDGLSDQFMRCNKASNHRKVFALSLKSYPAIITATRLGKPIWFDEINGGFTSSKKYFTKLPKWLVNFNQEKKLSKLTSVTWQTAYQKNSKYYDFPDIKNYDYAGFPFSLISLPSIAIDHSTKNPYELFLKTPHASKALIDLAKGCVDQNFTHANDRMLLWICLSNFDLCGHIYGPDSMENIDLLYHLDWQIQDFMDSVRRRLGEKNCLFVLTGDHGISPIPELAYKQGMTLAKRIMAPQLIKDLNEYLAKKHEFHDIVKVFEPTFFNLNKELLARLDQATRNTIIDDVKTFLMNQPGIKKVWTAQELEKLPTTPGEPEHFYKTQLYYGRSGDIICMPQPHCLIGYYPTGTSHMTPYEYDTHVPLVIYQKGRFQKRTITEKVWIPQLPISLAHIAGVGCPSVSSYPVLPEIIR